MKKNKMKLMPALFLIACSLDGQHKPEPKVTVIDQRRNEMNITYERLRQVQVFLKDNPHSRVFDNIDEFYQWLNSRPAHPAKRAAQSGRN